MVQQCSVCKKLNYLHPQLTFHCFPRDEKRRKEWVQALKLEDQKLPRRPLVCSNHFDAQCFTRDNKGFTYVKKWAVPTLFRLPLTELNVEVVSQASCSNRIEVSPQQLIEVIAIGPSETSSETSKESDNDEAVVGFTPPQNRIAKADLLFKQPINEVVTDQQYPYVAENAPGTLMYARTVSSSSTLTASETEEQAEQVLQCSQQGQGSGFAMHTASLQQPTYAIQATDIESSPSRIVTKAVKRKRRYVGDLTSDDFGSPIKAKKNFRKLKQTVIQQRKSIKVLKNSVKRLRQKITNMNSLLGLLKEKLLISASAEPTINAAIQGPAAQLFQRMLRGRRTQKYSPELRSFALTLSFYSPRAYNYVRKTFNRSLPHLNTLAKWYQTVDGSPGFSQEALTALKLKAGDSTHSQIFCNLVLNEMSIRKQVEWKGKKFAGYVDLGTDLDGDNLPAAKEALVFMLVGINTYWKIPVAYFLLDGLAGSEKAELVKRCLNFIHQSGVIVTSLTFGGAPVNFNMARELGADFSGPEHLVTST